MFAIQVEYLTGRAVATNRESRSEAEWPPHPQRLFAALVAAYHECDLGDDVRAALKWLESLLPPALVVSEAAQRVCPETYVPVNDNNTQFVHNRKKHTIKYTTAIDSGIALGRDRKERYFPTVVPHDPLVQFVWNDADYNAVALHQNALEQVTEAVAYLGHSTSLVRLSVTNKPRPVTLSTVSESSDPSKRDVRLRGVTSGRLETLEQAYTQSVETCRRREAPDSPWHRYRWIRDEPASTFAAVNAFGGESDWFVFQRKSGTVLPIQACLALTTSVRKTLCSVCEDPLPSLLSGHGEDQGPLERTHVAFVPLANVGYQHSDSEIHGFAIVLPNEASTTEKHQSRRQLAMALGKMQQVWKNPSEAVGENAALAFDWKVEAATASERLNSLQPQRYLRRSKYWASMTPMVFGHYLRKIDDRRTFKIVADSCEASGLPRPVNIRVSTTSMVSGVPQSYVFPSLSSAGKPVWVRYRNGKHLIPRKLSDGSTVRMRYHIALEFEEPVSGPVIVGAGRHYGMGLCVPINDMKEKR